MNWTPPLRPTQPMYEPTHSFIRSTTEPDFYSSLISTHQETTTISPSPQTLNDENEDSLLDYLYLLFLLFVPGGGGVGYVTKRCLKKIRRRNVEFLPQVQETRRNDIGELAMDVIEEAIEMCDIQGHGGQVGVI